MTADAMVGLATGKKREREQEIHTPQVVIDFVETLWGGSISLDPCSSLSTASLLRSVPRQCHGPTVGNMQDGLAPEWIDRTYVNPPYGNLKTWLAKAVKEAVGPFSPRIALLAPTRGHRTWWHEARASADSVLELAPLRFVGYPGTFPAPLSLLLWNVDKSRVARALRGSELRATRIEFPSLF